MQILCDASVPLLQETSYIGEAVKSLAQETVKLALAFQEDLEDLANTLSEYSYLFFAMCSSSVPLVLSVNIGGLAWTVTTQLTR